MLFAASPCEAQQCRHLCLLFNLFYWVLAPFSLISCVVKQFSILESFEQNTCLNFPSGKQQKSLSLTYFALPRVPQMVTFDCEDINQRLEVHRANAVVPSKPWFSQKSATQQLESEKPKLQLSRFLVFSTKIQQYKIRRSGLLSRFQLLGPVSLFCQISSEKDPSDILI